MSETYFDEKTSRHQLAIAASQDMVEQRRIMVSRLGLKFGEHVLDVGCGCGAFARDMKAAVGAGGHVCGLDGSESMLRLAKTIGPEIEFQKGDARKLLALDESYDVVTMSQILCFVPDIDLVLTEVLRVLKPGGRVMILDTDWASLVWNCSDQSLMDRVLKLMMSQYACDHVPRTLSRRLRHAGFHISGRFVHNVLSWKLESNTYAEETATFLKSVMASSPDFTDTDWETWYGDQVAISDAGEFMFSLNRYIFMATKR